ncbi:MAG TPA: methyltransferase domain-containing protein [Cytophagaceae bacterium]|jgi:2-polyprenyl-3-methyl-5-hydroxy-6-metoxy-1,4-benzoquinol methylase
MFDQRSTEIEIMDDLDIKGDVIDSTLKELNVINKWLGGNSIIVHALDILLKDSSKKNITLADLGCGGGDLLKLMSNRLRKKNIASRLIGVDANPHIIEYAKKNCSSHPEIEFQSINIFSEEFKAQKFDVVASTLFFHHFDDQTLTDFLKQLSNQASIGIIINDLHRHWFAYHSIKWITAIFSKSFMVKNDAKVSVQRGFLKEELENIIQKAGFTKYEIKWRWAFRYQVVIWV